MGAVAVLAELPAAETKEFRDQVFKAQKPCMFRTGRKGYNDVAAFQAAYKPMTKDGDIKVTPFNEVISTDIVSHEVGKAICTEAQTADEAQISNISRKDMLKFVHGFMPVIKAPAVQGGKKVESKKTEEAAEEEAAKEDAPKVEAPKVEAPKEDAKEDKKSSNDKKKDKKSKDKKKDKKSSKDKKAS